MAYEIRASAPHETLEDLCTRLLRISTQGDMVAVLSAAGNLDARSLIDQLPGAVYIKDRCGRFAIANRRTAANAAIDDPNLLIGKTDFDFFDADCAESLFHAEQEVMATGEPIVDLEHCLAFGGEQRWLQSTKTPLRDADGEVVGLIGMSRDITERKRRRDLTRGHARLLDMIARGKPLGEVLPALVSLVESELHDVVASILLLDEGSGRLRHGATSSLPEAYVKLIDGRRIGPQAASCGTAAFRREPVIVTDVLEDPLWENYRDLALCFGFRSCWSTPILGAEGHVLGTFALYSDTPRGPVERELEFTAMATDIAGIAIERSRSEERIRFMAHHDPLTGLPNRTLFLEQFNRILAEAHRETRSVTVAYIDLDNFKLINDTFGHAAGDEVLKVLAGRLSRFIRASDIMVRLGGDEFAIVFNSRDRNDEGIIRRLEELRGVVCSPIEVGGQPVQVTCSMGAAFFPQDGATPEALLSEADRAMYDAKNDGRNCFQLSPGR